MIDYTEHDVWGVVEILWGCAFPHYRDEGCMTFEEFARRNEDTCARWKEMAVAILDSEVMAAVVQRQAVTRA